MWSLTRLEAITSECHFSSKYPSRHVQIQEALAAAMRLRVAVQDDPISSQKSLAAAADAILARAMAAAQCL